MTDTDWTQNSGNLCYGNCGIEVQTKGRAITRVRGDKADPTPRVTSARRAQRLTISGNHADRLTSPLRRRPDELDGGGPAQSRQ